MTSCGRIEVPVLVVGAGPSGLCASILLSLHGVESLTVERHPGTSIYPRATGINVRSMEIFRSIGIADQIRRASFNAEPGIAFSRVLTDAEPRVSPSFRPQGLDVSPEEWTSCSQKELEPILLRAATSYPQARLLFGTELLGFEVTADGINACIGDRATGLVREVRCKYLVAADGSESRIRERLGLKMHGVGVLGHNVSIHFSAPLKRHLPNEPHFLHFVQNDDVAGMFIATDAGSRWVFAVQNQPGQGESPDSFKPARAIELIRKGAGLPGLEIKVEGIVPWKMEADSVESWRVGNVFLAGDAAHRMTPAGGLGLNTGIQDVHNLCWKLAAVIHGWADQGLLDTYETERRPVAEYNVDRSVSMITGDDKVNHRTGLDVDLGFIYASRAIVPDGSELAPTSNGDYAPVARPGSRAPHLWLEGERGRASMLDLFGPHFTLLTGRRSKGWRFAAGEIADELQVPLLDRTEACRGAHQGKNEAWMAHYGVEETGAVLIRPDGHVAWRSAAAPFEAGEVRRALNTVIGRCGDPALSR